MQLEQIKNISIVGAGTMGHGIGLTYALGGYKVTLHDRNEDILRKALQNVVCSQRLRLTRHWRI